MGEYDLFSFVVFMASLVTCDICGKTCYEWVHFQGWYTKVLVSKEQERFAPKLEKLNIEAHAHRDCFNQAFPDINLSETPTRKALYEHHVTAHPKEKGVEGLRLTAGWNVTEVFCDFCGAKCYEKHLKLRANWTDTKRVLLGAEICEKCVENRMKVVKFSILAKD